MVEVPAPSIFAPIAMSSAARSVTSGSRAQFSKTVSPSASVAAISRSSVPVTVILSKTMCAPFSRSEIGKVGDLGLACAVLEDGLAVGQCGSHQQVFRSGDGDLVEDNVRALQSIRDRQGR